MLIDIGRFCGEEQLKSAKGGAKRKLDSHDNRQFIIKCTLSVRDRHNRIARLLANTWYSNYRIVLNRREVRVYAHASNKSDATSLFVRGMKITGTCACAYGILFVECGK